MNIPFVDLKLQYQSIKDDIDAAIRKVIENANFIGGSEVLKFENEFAELLGIKNCISTANGTDALYIALRMLGIGEGDEVITTSHSWISTSETISQTGAKPVFVDVEDQYFTIDPKQVEEQITSRTKAIIPVHIYGQPCDMEKIMEIAKAYNLFVIEDCAQSHLSMFNGQLIGTFGNVSTFSFYPGKNLGAYGDAGAVISNDDELAVKMKMFSNHGALVKHNHIMEGINSRLDTLQAAILSVKLSHLKSWTKKRQDNAAKYSSRLQGVGDIELPKERPSGEHSYHLYVIKTSRRDELKKYLDSKNITTAIHYPTILPLLPAYKRLGYNSEDFPVAYQNQQQILSLPMFPELMDDQINEIVETIKDFFKR